MKRLLILLALLVTPATANPVIVIWVDGAPIGTMARFEYRLADSNIWIETNEGVFGCQQDIIFWDRFD